MCGMAVMLWGIARLLEIRAYAVGSGCAEAGRCCESMFGGTLNWRGSGGSLSGHVGVHGDGWWHADHVGVESGAVWGVVLGAWRGSDLDDVDALVCLECDLLMWPFPQRCVRFAGRGWCGLCGQESGDGREEWPDFWTWVELYSGSRVCVFLTQIKTNFIAEG